MDRSIAELFMHDDEQFVRAAYLTILGRSPDPEGLGNYLEQVRSGVPKQQIVDQLGSSEEASKRPGKTKSKGFEDVETGRASVMGLDKLMLMHDRMFIRAAYLLILSREADNEGMNVYLAHLRSGKSKTGILKCIHESEESRHRQRTISEWFEVTENTTLTPLRGEAQESKNVADQMQSSVPPPLDGLLSYDSTEMLSVVYRCILGRSPSIKEQTNQSTKTYYEKSKVKILVDILQSKEILDARDIYWTISRQIKKYTWSQLPLIGNLVKWITDVEGERGSDRCLRRIENQLFRMFEESPQEMPNKMYCDQSPPRHIDFDRNEHSIEQTDYLHPNEEPIVTIQRSPSDLLRTFATKGAGFGMGRIEQ